MVKAQRSRLSGQGEAGDVPAANRAPMSDSQKSLGKKHPKPLY